MSKIYENKCVCGKKIEVKSQEDDEPEYYTNIEVKCVCGKFIEFSIPVN